MRSFFWRIESNSYPWDLYLYPLVNFLHFCLILGLVLFLYFLLHLYFQPGFFLFCLLTFCLALSIDLPYSLAHNMGNQPYELPKSLHILQLYKYNYLFPLIISCYSIKWCSILEDPIQITYFKSQFLYPPIHLYSIL